MRHPFTLLLAAALIGCAQAPVTTSLPAPTQVERALSAFRAEGKLAWNQAGKGDSARFVWSYAAPKLRIDVLSPLGSTAATIDAEPGRAVLETAKGDQFTAASLEALSTRVFGMTLPLTGMEYWAQGLPVPDWPFTEEMLPTGKRIHQRGFTLDYPVWAEVQGRSLPSQVDISSKDLTLKIRIKEWSLQ